MTTTFQRSTARTWRQSAVKLGASLCLVSSVLLAAQTAHAQTSPEQRRNLLSLSNTATLEVTQDLLTVTLQAVKDGTSAAEVQTQLKQILDAGLAEARKAAKPDAMDVRTGNFSIHPRYSNQGKINGWQGQAQLVLEGPDMVRIAQTAGRLDAMNVTQVGYGLSKALREKTEASLTGQAIAGFRARALDMAKAFGFGGFTLAEVSVQSGEPGFEGRPVPMMMMKSARADMAQSAPLPVEPGKGTVSVTVSGQVALTP